MSKTVNGYRFKVKDRATTTFLSGKPCSLLTSCSSLLDNFPCSVGRKLPKYRETVL